MVYEGISDPTNISEPGLDPEMKCGVVFSDKLENIYFTVLSGEQNGELSKHKNQ